ncbi:DUF1206 domain-containing protein [Salinisphaera sp. T31B1]|uniref:DUF1206 domain-containing protein n=1 Tax=Salinisphaera sp. T31B1 TaxID=727963 RepID=UPI00334017D9
MSTHATQRAPSKGVEWLARFGYAAKGVVYVVIGVLAAMSAFHIGGRTTSTHGAMSTIGSQPFGQILLIVMAAGLIGYVIWRFVQAIKDPEHRGRSPGGLLKRVGLLGSGVIYASLAVYTIRLLIGSHSSGGGSTKQSMTARLMSHEGGVWLVAAIGALIVGIAIMQFVRAYKRGFEKRWSVATMGPTQRRWAGHIAQWGLSARGVVFLIMGAFLLLGAWQTDPDEATGLDGALNALSGESYGLVLLGVVALGLICYGLYCWVNAIHRRIDP